jgi:hypothetical protein
MWILRFTYCLFAGHAFIDITNTKQPYQYCLHCGKVKVQDRLSDVRHMRSTAVHSP